jgi:MFS family permease
MALAPNLPVYFFAWSLMGCGMASGLYDVAFGALGRIYGLEARRAITVVTLWGGFASTVFWALSGVLVTSIGWRGTCAVFALMHLAIALPIYRWVLPPAAPLDLEEGASPPDVTLSPLARQAVALFGVVLMAETLVASIVSVHLINILQDRGLQLAAAVGLAAFIGPAQVSARFGESLMGVRHHPSLTMIVAVGGMALGVALVALLPSSAAVAALVIYGIGLGLVSVARGALPLYLFGPLEAPVVTGRLARPIALVQAIAPSAGAVLLTRVGAGATLWVLAIVGGVSLVAALWLRSLSRRMAGEAGG